MKIVLPDALHARPANLLVRAARKLAAAVFVHKDDRKADAREILQVLSLRAAKGDEIHLSSDDPEALASVAALIIREFDPDLVPEVGMTAAAGIAIGEAVVEDDIEVETRVGDDDDSRVIAAFAEARRELAEVLEGLSEHEKQLFEPEGPILDALEPAVIARFRRGERAEEAIRAETCCAPSDLLDDARARLLSAFNGTPAALQRVLEARQDRELVLVTRQLTPTLVARLPKHVSGVIAVIEHVERASRPPPSAVGSTSHAAILARGRGLPLVYVPPDVASAIFDEAPIVVDTTEGTAKVWVDPTPARLAEAKRKRDELARGRAHAIEAARSARTLVAIRANVGSTSDHVPDVAAGIGLVRTELVFAGKSGAPREDEQVAAYRAIAKKTRGPVYVRLFDAGGDKHLEFLPDRGGLRGVELLFAHDDVLRTQLRAIARARELGDVRVLIPLVRHPGDVANVRERAPAGVPVGAMIETAQAASDALAIAGAADFVCIGTNDLTADVLHASRESGADSFDPRVIQAIQRTIDGAHRAGRPVTVCGELAADPHGARVLVGLGVDALSVAASRVADVALDLSRATREDCAAAAAAVSSREDA